MKAQAAVKQLNRDLSLLKTLRANETKALTSIQAQEQKVVDNFVAAPSVAGFMSAIGQVFALGTKEATTKDKFDTAIAKDKSSAIRLLKPAADALSLKQLNVDRHALGLAALKSKPAPKYGQPWHPGAGRLSGADTSHYQSNATFEQSIRGKQFTAIKATEGTGYTDPNLRSRWNELGKKIQAGKMSLRVAYHFLTPGNGAGQAKHFLATLGIHGKLPAGTRLALDWEGAALSSPKTLHDAANYVHKVTGLWPLIYTSASRVAAARAAAPQAPMWEAKWGGSVPTNVPFVQTADGPGFDHDVFNGNLAALRKFAGF
jgi:hypothetical protein